MFSIDFACYEFYIIVEAEDAGDEQEGLGDIDQQTVRHVVDHDDLVRNQRDAAHDEQHRTGVLRDFEARVFHRIRGTRLDHACTTCCAEDGGDDVAQDLENGFHGFVHSVVCFLSVDE